MRLLVLIVLSLTWAAANADQPQQLIDVQHDAHRGATCWIIPGTVISCLPDSQLKRQPNVTPDHIKGSPAPASTTTPRQYDERVQL